MLYILGIVIILVNAVVMTFGSMIGLSGWASPSMVSTARVLPSSLRSFLPNANALVSGAHAVVAFIEIARCAWPRDGCRVAAPRPPGSGSGAVPTRTGAHRLSSCPTR